MTQAEIQSLIDKYSQRYGINPEIAQKMFHTESGLDPAAVSGKGAQGLGQLMPETAKSLGVTDVNDPEQNIEASLRYLKQNLDKHNGDYRLALASYNAGPGAVERYGGVPPFKETQDYVNNIMGPPPKIDWGEVAKTTPKIKWDVVAKGKPSDNKPEEFKPGFAEGSLGALGGPSTPEELTALEKQGQEFREHPVVSSLKLATPAIKLGEMVKDYGTNLWDRGKEAIQDAYDAGQNIGNDQPVIPNLNKAALGALRTTNAAIPLVGEQANKVGEDIFKKNYGAAAGRGITTLGLLGLGGDEAGGEMPPVRKTAASIISNPKVQATGRIVRDFRINQPFRSIGNEITRGVNSFIKEGEQARAAKTQPLITPPKTETPAAVPGLEFESPEVKALKQKSKPTVKSPQTEAPQTEPAGQGETAPLIDTSAFESGTKPEFTTDESAGQNYESPDVKALKDSLRQRGAMTPQDETHQIVGGNESPLIDTSSLNKGPELTPEEAEKEFGPDISPYQSDETDVNEPRYKQTPTEPIPLIDIRGLEPKEPEPPGSEDVNMEKWWAGQEPKIKNEVPPENKFPNPNMEDIFGIAKSWVESRPGSTREEFVSRFAPRGQEAAGQAFDAAQGAEHIEKNPESLIQTEPLTRSKTPDIIKNMANPEETPKSPIDEEANKVADEVQKSKQKYPFDKVTPEDLAEAQAEVVSEFLINLVHSGKITEKRSMDIMDLDDEQIVKEAKKLGWNPNDPTELDKVRQAHDSFHNDKVSQEDKSELESKLEKIEQVDEIFDRLENTKQLRSLRGLTREEVASQLNLPGDIAWILQKRISEHFGDRPSLIQTEPLTRSKTPDIIKNMANPEETPKSEPVPPEVQEAIGPVEDRWERFGLGGDDDVDYNSGHIAGVSDAIEEYLKTPEGQSNRENVVDSETLDKYLDEKIWGSPGDRSTPAELLSEASPHVSEMLKKFAGFWEKDGKIHYDPKKFNVVKAITDSVFDAYGDSERIIQTETPKPEESNKKPEGISVSSPSGNGRKGARSREDIVEDQDIANNMRNDLENQGQTAEKVRIARVKPDVGKKTGKTYAESLEEKGIDTGDEKPLIEEPKTPIPVSKATTRKQAIAEVNELFDNDRITPDEYEQRLREIEHRFRTNQP